MDAAGLTEEQKELVRRRDRAEVALAVADELARKDPTVMAPWPSQSIKVLSVSPTGGQLGTVVTLTVTGQWFSSKATCELLLGSETLNTKVSSVTTGESSSLTAEVRLSQTTRLGAWDVRVANSAKDYDMLPGAFNVIA
jgi:hypothetical protein